MLSYTDELERLLTAVNSKKSIAEMSGQEYREHTLNCQILKDLGLQMMDDIGRTKNPDNAIPRLLSIINESLVRENFCMISVALYAAEMHIIWTGMSLSSETLKTLALLQEKLVNLRRECGISEKSSPGQYDPKQEAVDNLASLLEIARQIGRAPTEAATPDRASSAATPFASISYPPDTTYSTALSRP